jgi:hypothetical protein
MDGRLMFSIDNVCLSGGRTVAPSAATVIIETLNGNKNVPNRSDGSGANVPRLGEI